MASHSLQAGEEAAAARTLYSARCAASKRLDVNMTPMRHTRMAEPSMKDSTWQDRGGGGQGWASQQQQAQGWQGGASSSAQSRRPLPPPSLPFPPIIKRTEL